MQKTESTMQSQPIQSPNCAYRVLPCSIGTRSTRDSRVQMPVRLTMRPTGSTKAEIPVLVTHTRDLRCSMDRKLARARCSIGSVDLPYQESLVRLNIASGTRFPLPGRISVRILTGKISS